MEVAEAKEPLSAIEGARVLVADPAGITEVVNGQ